LSVDKRPEDKLRSRNIALAGFLVALAVLFFLITMVKISGPQG